MTSKTNEIPFCVNSIYIYIFIYVRVCVCIMAWYVRSTIPFMLSVVGFLVIICDIILVGTEQYGQI